MTEYVTVEIKGLAELQQKLEALPEKVAKRGVRAGLRAGADVLRTAIIQLAPKATGFLSQHFGTKIKMTRDALAGTAYVGPQGKVDYPAYASGAYDIKRSKRGKAMKVGRIAVATVVRYLEFGTSKMAKHPFFTAAFDTTRDNILSTIIQRLKDAVED